jgi:hypothetical protein
MNGVCSFGMSHGKVHTFYLTIFVILHVAEIVIYLINEISFVIKLIE